MKLRTLEIALEGLEGFEKPDPGREQYSTPAVFAARLLHHAHLLGDIEGKAVCDLGSGTGVLALGAALLGADRVVGVELDPAALEAARRNAARLGAEVTFIQGDVRDPGLISGLGRFDTVIMNPPFGAQDPHADRPFVDAALVLAPVVYGIFNSGSLPFLEAYTDGRAEIEFAIGGILPLKRTLPFHRKELVEIEVEILRMKRR
ncbi:MAG TPA: METTL5 family protein [Methanomicrobiales archaeon]|nr:METTL5 family protein [Methanomicrobiales archaeon]